LPVATYEQLASRTGVLTVSDLLRLAVDQFLHAQSIAPHSAFVNFPENRQGQ